MAFRDLNEFLIVEPLVLPIRGKEYTFPGQISAPIWLKLQSIGEQVQDAVSARDKGEDFEPDVEAISDMDQESLMAEFCGGPQTMKKIIKGLTSEEFKHVLSTLMVYHMSGSRELAEAIWNQEGELPAPNRAARRSSKPTPSTRSRGSRVGSKPPPAKGSQPGETSSSTGT